jgi:hypothetical protein
LKNHSDAERSLLRMYSVLAGLNIVSAGILVSYHAGFTTPYSEYAHRLVNYDHGFIRRAFVGEIYSIFVERVPLWAVNSEGFLAVLSAIFLGWCVFTRTVQVARPQKLAMACFVFGSPFLFKNFLGSLGKFDVLGACVAMLAVLVPLNAWAVIIIGVLSAMLLMIHHILATLYLPTIYGVLLIRILSAQRETRRQFILIAICSLIALVGLFLDLVLLANPAVSPDEFQALLQEHAAFPICDYLYSMWFSTLPEEIGKTRLMFPINIARLPFYVILAALHWPLICTVRRHFAATLPRNRAERGVFLSVVGVVMMGYLATVIVAFDYARFASDAFFCLLLLTAARILSVTGPITDTSAIDFSDFRVVLCATLIALIPWVGTITPAISDLAFRPFNPPFLPASKLPSSRERCTSDRAFDFVVPHSAPISETPDGHG